MAFLAAPYTLAPRSPSHRLHVSPRHPAAVAPRRTRALVVAASATPSARGPGSSRPGPPAEVPGRRVARWQRALKVTAVAVVAGLTGVWARPVRAATERAQGAAGRPAVVAMAARAGRSGTTVAQTQSRAFEDDRLSDRDKLVTMGMTTGAVGGLFFWAFKKNRKDDEEEAVRIKSEVERLEKWKKEFLDVEEDDDSVPDEEMMAELRKRMGGTEETTDDEDKTESPTSEQKPTESPSSAGPGAPGAAVLDRPGEDAPQDAGSDDEQPPEVSQENLDMLRRMWEASSKDDKNEKKDDGAQEKGTSTRGGTPSAVLERAEDSTDDDASEDAPVQADLEFLQRMWDASEPGDASSSTK